MSNILWNEKKLNIPFEEIEKAFIEVVDKAIAGKRHIYDDEVTLATKVGDAAIVLYLYRDNMLLFGHNDFKFAKNANSFNHYGLACYPHSV